MKRYFKFYRPIYDLDNEYFVKNVEYEREQAAKRIKVLEEEIERLDKYLFDCDVRKAYIEDNVTYAVEVIIERGRDYSSNKVHYDVYANRFITDNNGIKHTERIKENRRFSGKERKAALNYADELGKKYNVEVVRKYFDWKW